MELIRKDDVRSIVNDICNHALKIYDKTYHLPIRTITVSAIERIGRLPTIESRPKGKWEATSTFPRVWICSNCTTRYGERMIFKKHICEVCGAEMEIE